MSKKVRGLALCLSALIFLSASVFVLPSAAQDEDELPLTADFGADVAQRWMQLLYDEIEALAISPPAGARLYAYAGITLYESVLGGIPDYFSLAGQLTDMPPMPLPEQGTAYDWPSSANAALATALSGLLPERSKQAIDTLLRQQTNARLRRSEEDVVNRSLAYGESVGQAILDWAVDDGFLDTRDLEWEPPTGDPSLWVPTAPGMKTIEPYWGDIRPFAMYNANQCAERLNIEFSELQGSTFYLQALETKTVGDNLTEEQKTIARYWVDAPGETGTPAGHWVLIENQLVDLLGLDLSRAAQMYALVNIALGDAFISCWKLKYQINLLRPVTYIQRYIDPNWQPFIQTPGFPEYPSGHSVVSAAAAEVLTRMFGQVAFTDRSGRKHGYEDRSFTSFYAAANEAAISRLYGGIHFRVGIENGMRQGQCVGRNVLDYVALRSVPQGE